MLKSSQDLNQLRVKILTAFHKPYMLFETEVFQPIHVGRAVSLKPAKDKTFTDDDKEWLLEHMIGDDTGVNISSRNRNFSELTGIYWAWNNYEKLGSPDYIGFMQYRRHFIFAEEVYDNYQHHNDDERAYSKINVGSIYDGYQDEFGLVDDLIIRTCDQYDLIIPKSCELSYVGLRSIREDYTMGIEGTKSKDLRLLLKAVKKVAPDYFSLLTERLTQSNKRCYQSFVMRRELFFEYCEFLFSVLFEIDRELNTETYSTNGQRTLGYLGEILFDCFTAKQVNQKKIRIKELGMTYICSESIPKPIRNDSAIVMLAHSDYESLEISLAAHAKFLPQGVKFFILVNGRGSYDCERTLRVAKRFESLYPLSVEVIDDIKPQEPYYALKKLLESNRMRSYRYICKVDDDTFPITSDWFDQLCSVYENTYSRYGSNTAYVSGLVNNNPFGFKALLEQCSSLNSDYFAHIAREHLAGREGSSSSYYPPARIISASEIDDDICGTVWRYSYIARWLHERTSLQPEFYKEIVKNLPDVYLGSKRYSINCILFNKDYWSLIEAPDSEFPTDDEFLSEQYCRDNKMIIMVRLSVPLVHLFFFTQREENKDLVDIFRTVYSEWLGLPYPISIQSNRLLEIESRLRSLERSMQSQVFKKRRITFKERAKRNKLLRTLWKKAPARLRRVVLRMFTQ
jgi:hypothetical protein